MKPRRVSTILPPLPPLPVMVLVPEEVVQQALRLLTAYANSGVTDAVSLECAQVCRVLRDRLGSTP